MSKYLKYSDRLIVSSIWKSCNVHVQSLFYADVTGTGAKTDIGLFSQKMMYNSQNRH